MGAGHGKVGLARNVSSCVLSQLDSLSWRPGLGLGHHSPLTMLLSCLQEVGSIIGKVGAQFYSVRTST